MKYIVTGGAGFIGSHLITQLLEDGHQVICIDNLKTGSERNIRHLENSPDFEFIKHDVINPYDIPADGIFNLACPASPLHYQRNPVNTMNTTVSGIKNAIDNALRYDIPLLQTSTSEIYGDPLEHPQREDYWGNVNPLGPRACYNEAKRFAETMLYNYHIQYNLEMKIVRIFNTYGPNMQMNDGRVISNFIVQALTGNNITIYGEGTQTRSFCYVDDMVRGIIKMMNSRRSGPINIGNDNEITILSLARKIVDIVGGSPEIVFKTLPAEDPKRRKPSIEKAGKYLDWQPVVSLDEGLNKTVQYFDSLIRKETDNE